MRFLVDAQLPRRLAVRLAEAGHDALHTLDLAEGNRALDAELVRLADAEGRVLITKDADFVHSFHLNGRPRKLLLVSTGNIANSDLERLLLPQLPVIVAAYSAASFVELTRTSLIVHG
jgi:predicted nuclease of predicted toxin-antitoxin system